MRAQVLGITACWWLVGARLPALVVLVGSLAGCGGAGAHGGLRPVPERSTRATLVGPLCDGQECTCRDSGNDPGVPLEPELKRYELRVGPTDNELWVMVDDMVLYKTVERASACFYVDLRPGKHAVTVRAQSTPGLAARLSIAELGPRGAYRVFHFDCGSPGYCERSQIDSWKQLVTADRRAITDPCSATRVSGITWNTGNVPDLVHPVELQLELFLDVYAFAPAFTPGDPACAAK